MAAFAHHLCTSTAISSCPGWMPPTRQRVTALRSGGSGSSSGSGGGSRQCGRVAGVARGSSSSEAADTGSSSSDAQKPKRQRRRSVGGSGLRREDLAFFIARSDLTWEQPWGFEQSAALAELALRQQGVAALDDDAVAASGTADAAQHVQARFTVQLPGGLGALVVRGSVEASIPLRCEFCGDAFQAAVAEPFEGVIHLEGASAVLNNADVSSGGAELALAANELIMEADANLCDITPLIADAIVGSLPTVCLCGGASCRQHAGREVVWSATPPAAAAGMAATSPFAKLLAGGGQAVPKKGRNKSNK